MELIDVHCHVHSSDFDADRAAVLARARESGVVAIITSTLRYGEIGRALQLAEEYRGYVYVSVGLDPTVFDPAEASRVASFIEEHADRIVAVGEVGLDFLRVTSPVLRSLQVQNLLRWARLADGCDLPLVVHSRRAGRWAIRALVSAGCSRVIMHAFDGSLRDALAGERAGFLFSVPPSVLTSRRKQELVRALELESLLLESDAPALGPTRGERNEPANVARAAACISRLKGVELEEVAKVTTRNAKSILRLG
ncbi:MAG: hypothetical protein DRJ56_00885 [Thermoprotei archaeon]|nr:MAG: hypothetical protein DRJ56_00885 [Thermoprotei archaeon]